MQMPNSIDVYINGSRYRAISASTLGYADYSIANGTIQLHLNQGDYIEIYALQLSPQTTSISVAGEPFWCNLSIHKIY